jgi:hypothetical protein
MRKHTRDCIRLCHAEGLTVLGTRAKGKHWSVICAEGEIVFPCTPGDQRWIRNARALVRRHRM